jgi:hypothetical protein
MGLDILAIEKAVRVSDEVDKDFKELYYYHGIEIEEGAVVRVKVNTGFDSHDHLQDGIYLYQGSIEFGAGSYGTYNGFRNDLSLIAHGVFAQVIWANPEIYKGSDFYELINFSDCEGVIGPMTSQKLTSDFKKHREAYALENNEWDLERYDNWTKAFELAGNDGMVIFC